MTHALFIILGLLSRAPRLGIVVFFDHEVLEHGKHHLAEGVHWFVDHNLAHNGRLAGGRRGAESGHYG